MSSLRERRISVTLVRMKVVVLYRPDSEYASMTEAFIRDFKMRNTDVRLEEINVDSSEGNSLTSLYDITQYPAILVVAEDGSLVQFWQGTELPLMDEVASYAYSGQ